MDLIQALSEHETANKLKFARAWLEDPQQPYRAAMKLFPTNGHLAWTAAQEWVNDKIVLAEVERLKQVLTEDDLLPTKAAYLKELLEHARDARKNDPEVGFKYDNLYASMRGHIEKPTAASVTVNNVTVNRVMIQKDHGTNEEYAVTLEGQQNALMHDNDGDITHASNHE